MDLNNPMKYGVALPDQKRIWIIRFQLLDKVADFDFTRWINGFWITQWNNASELPDEIMDLNCPIWIPR